jgi:hypothetical protein
MAGTMTVSSPRCLHNCGGQEVLTLTMVNSQRRDEVISLRLRNVFSNMMDETVQSLVHILLGFTIAWYSLDLQL